MNKPLMTTVINDVLFECTVIDVGSQTYYIHAKTELQWLLLQQYANMTKGDLVEMRVSNTTHYVQGMAQFSRPAFDDWCVMMCFKAYLLFDEKYYD